MRAKQLTAGLPNVIYYHAALHMFMSNYSVLARWASSGSWPWVLGGDAASCCSAHWLISACGFGQHWQQALDTLKVIRQTAVLPIVTSYSAVTAVINACEGGQHWHQALGLLAAMQQFAVLANVIYYHAAIHLYMYIYSVLARWASSGSRPWVRGGDAAS